MKYPVGTCWTCGKLKFVTRKAAKAHAKKEHPSEHLATYICEGYYHYGHVPYLVSRGVQDRREV